MRILITGGAGFVGGHLTEQLLKLGHELVVVDNESATSSDKFNWFEKAENYKLNILNKNKMEEIFQSKIDYVFHLAAETKIQLAIDEPENCFNTNIMGTVSILELSRKYKVKRFILASTSAIYGMNNPPHTESQKEDCLNPYAASKLCDEIICKMYYNLYGLETVCFRFFNIYGEKMPNRGSYAPVIAIFDRQRKNNEAMTITGDGEQRRDFVYIKDVVDALILGVNSENSKMLGNVYNIGSGENYSVNEVATMLTGECSHILPRLGDARITLADITKINNDLDWQPKTKLKKWILSRST